MHNVVFMNEIDTQHTHAPCKTPHTSTTLLVQNCLYKTIMHKSSLSTEDEK